jgi:hypothetical protein
MKVLGKRENRTEQNRTEGKEKGEGKGKKEEGVVSLEEEEDIKQEKKRRDLCLLPGHESQRAVTLSNDVRLNVSIVVLASPNETSRGLDRKGNHIINQTMFVSDFCRIILLLVVPDKRKKKLEMNKKNEQIDQAKACEE